MIAQLGHVNRDERANPVDQPRHLAAVLTLGDVELPAGGAFASPGLPRVDPCPAGVVQAVAKTRLAVRRIDTVVQQRNLDRWERGWRPGSSRAGAALVLCSNALGEFRSDFDPAVRPKMIGSCKLPYLPGVGNVV